MAKLLILSGKRKGAEIELPGEGEVVDIGNRDSAKLAIHDPWISFNHAEIKSVNGRYLIEDQGSSNGTWVLKGSNAERVERHELSAEDVFALGNTRVRFMVEGVVPAADAGSDEPAPPAADKPWWDKVIDDDGGGKDDGQRVRLLKRELAEEKRMRQALEKFLDLPVGATVGDASKAGELELRVRELETQLEQAKEEAKEGAKSGVLPSGDMLTKHTQRLRRGHMSEVVSLEGRATTAEAKVADLETRLRERTEASKKERAEQRTEIERLQHDLDELKAGGGTAGASVDERLTTLKDELAEVRKKLASTEEQRGELETELREAREGTVDKSDVEGIKAELKAALEQVAHHKGEQARVIQELDDVSMEQIEIEENLQAKIRALEAQLRDAGLEPGPAGGDAPKVEPKKKKSKKKKAKADEPAAEAPAEEAFAAEAPAAEAPAEEASAGAPADADLADDTSSGEELSLEDPPSGEELDLATPPSGDELSLEDPPSGEELDLAAPPSDEELKLEDPPSGEEFDLAAPPSDEELNLEAPPADEGLDLADAPAAEEFAPGDSGELEFNPLADDDDERPAG